MEITREQDIAKLGKWAADTIAKEINRLLSFKNHLVLGIPGGSSVISTFEALKTADIPWENVHIFMVDERLVPLTHNDSNFKQADELFIADLVTQGKLPKDNVHPFKWEEYFGIDDYKKELEQLGGAYDIVLLGAGTDGHIASLFPNHPTLNEKEPFLIINDSPKPPAQRMTISAKMIANASVAVLLFIGEHKRAALNAFQQEGKIDQCPARLVKQARNVHVFTNLT